MAVKIGNAFITKLQMTSGNKNIFEDFQGTNLAARATNLTPIIDTFTTVESTTWTAPTAVTRVEYLVVGGGGGAGNGYDNAGGYVQLILTPNRVNRPFGNCQPEVPTR